MRDDGIGEVGGGGRKQEDGAGVEEVGERSKRNAAAVFFIHDAKENGEKRR